MKNAKLFVVFLCAIAFAGLCTAYEDYPATSSQIEQGFTQLLSPGDSASFSMDGKDIKLTVLSVTGPAWAQIVISENEATDLAIGNDVFPQEKMFDFNFDEYYDVSVRLNEVGIVIGSLTDPRNASITIKKVREKIPEGAELRYSCHREVTCPDGTKQGICELVGTGCRCRAYTCTSAEDEPCSPVENTTRCYHGNAEHIKVCKGEEVDDGSAWVEQCANGCLNGECIKEVKVMCEDSDDGTDYFEKGTVTIKRGDNETKYEDKCIGEKGNILNEFSCDSAVPSLDEETRECIFGCREGKCVKVAPTIDEGPVEIDKNVSQTASDCQGCILDSKCYPFGYRSDGKYCFADTSSFAEQKASDSQCENNFECGSNVCVASKCVSQSLIKRILAWFASIFGK